MGYEFTVDEIREAVTIARIYSPGLTDERFQASRELGRRLGESGYLEAAAGLSRWEEERGIHCTEALDASEQLLKENKELEQKVADYQVTLEMVRGEVTQAQDRLHQLEEAIEQARKERQGEEKGLAFFKKRAEGEKQGINQDLEEYREKAGVTKEEIIGATQLKDQLTSRGFTIELTLDLCQEFAGNENAREGLAKALKEYQTLTNYNKQAEERQNALQADIKALEGNRQQLEGNLSQLRADVVHEEELRRFYQRYQAVSPLMEHLTTWRSIFLARCNNPLFADRFWTERQPPNRCPCCNYPNVVYDEKLYQALNQPVGEPIKLQLRE